MSDPRIANLARTLVNYSIRAQSRETISIGGNSVAEPLIQTIYEELLRKGVYPIIQMTPERATDAFFELGKKHHFNELPSYQKSLIRQLDGTIRIISDTNTRALSGVDPKKQQMLSKASKPVREQMLKKKWVLTLFPTAAFAQDAEMSLGDFEDFVYAATFSNEKDPVKAWHSLASMQERLIRKLRGADEIRIEGPETDLRMSVKGRRFINSAGTHNMPSGEIFTGPIESSVEGHVYYDFPVCVQGREVDGIRLTFRKGRVVEATAEKNNDFLNAMLDQDPGARRLGELGIGTNRQIQRFTKNILFDEKIGGTVHLAVGQSYAETGGKNRSALHWDMIKDLRKGGRITVDGKVFQKNGKFV
jgi:aminopeptidase